MRWRVKYVVPRPRVVFGAQIFVRSQSVLFSSHDVSLSTVESGGLLIGGLLLVVGYARTGFSEADVYPSRAVLRSSLTVLVVGIYLFSVGILSDVARRLRRNREPHLQAFVILVGLAGLAWLLTSNRFRRAVQQFGRPHIQARPARTPVARVWGRPASRGGFARVRDVAAMVVLVQIGRCVRGSGLGNAQRPVG